MQARPATPPGGDADETAISLLGLRKRFPDPAGGTFTAVDGIDLTIQRGEVVAFLGPNGAGKSTTIDLMLGLTRPDSGRVQIFGLEPLEAVRRGRISAVLQTGGLLPDLSVETTIRMIASLHPGADPERCLQRAGLNALRHRKVSKCSGGEQQRLRFALALLPDPELIVLDEPTAGMDVEARRDFWAAVREDAGHGLTVLFATHYLEEADNFADRIVLMNHGSIAADDSSASIRATVDGRTVSAVLPPEDSARLVGAPGVRVLATRGQRTYFDADDSDDLLRQVVNDTRASQIEVTPRSLEEAFVQLTSPAAFTTTREDHA